jgi:hypothetical protein
MGKVLGLHVLLSADDPDSIPSFLSVAAEKRSPRRRGPAIIVQFFKLGPKIRVQAVLHIRPGPSVGRSESSFTTFPRNRS